jgi:hypothetical protein
MPPQRWNARRTNFLQAFFREIFSCEKVGDDAFHQASGVKAVRRSNPTPTPSHRRTSMTALASTAEWTDLSAAEMAQTLGGADTKNYSAIAFVGGWGASSYQYAF